MKKFRLTCHSALRVARWRCLSAERRAAQERLRSVWLEERLEALTIGHGGWGLPPDYVVPVPVTHPGLRIFASLIVLVVIAIAAHRIFWRGGLLNLPFLLMAAIALVAVILNVYIYEKWIRPRMRAVSAAHPFLVMMLLLALSLLMLLLMFWGTLE